MKAVILAGGDSLKLYPLTKDTPKVMLPIANKPLLEYSISLLKSKGIKDIIITLGDAKEKFINYFGCGEKWKVNIKYCIEPYPLGTAACLRNVRPYLDSDPFMVINGGALAEVNIDSMLFFHRENNACVTIGQIQNETSLSPALLLVGIYIFNQEVFDFIPEKGNFDIKEQLLPLLKDERRSVYSFQLSGYWNSLFTISDYMRANCDILQNKTQLGSLCGLKDSSKRGLTANSFESIVIGDNCNIHKGAKLIGPLAIADNCHVEEGVTIKNSIIWSGCHLKKGGGINHCVIGKNCYIAPNEDISDTVLFKNGYTINNINIAMKNLKNQPLSITFVRFDFFSRILNIVRLELYRVIKRTIDICISLIGLILTMPIFVLISFLIKIDSKGPLFFIHVRRMNENKSFGMIKFRSMVIGAEKIQEQLMHLNESNGPMFKIEHDPRFTRVGKFINKTKLDELPQLLNVLKGEMSLVGPRPLPEREMKYNPYWREARLMVKQGVTGAWQISGKQLPFRAWIKNDIFYVKNQSFWLDLKIIIKTILLTMISVEQALKDLLNKTTKRNE